jgi:hypothetical protein
MTFKDFYDLLLHYFGITVQNRYPPAGTTRSDLKAPAGTLLNRHFQFLAAWNATFLLALILSASPVARLCPMRAACSNHLLVPTSTLQHRRPPRNI